MNKTVTINISGIIFHIEEDAFEKLSKYLSTIKGYFSKTDGGSEIMSDIEARIAEMLQSKTSVIKQVVLMADVDSVIETMGKPEEFVEGSSETSGNEETETIYTEPTKRRLFRDSDRKAVGGVCSGIAAYFDIDIVWIRLAMFLLIFFGGLSLWVYIILWIVIPEAKTTADKLAMKGEKVDINNISKTVKEEAQQFKKRAEKFGNEIRDSHGNVSENFFDKLGNFIKEFLIMFTKFFARIIGLILLIFGVMFMLGLISSVFGFSIVGANTELNDWINLFFMERSHYVMGIIGVALFFGIPFLMMIYGGVKLLFKIHYSSRWLNISAGIFWLIGLITVLFVGITTGQDFNESAKVKEPVLLNTTHDTLYLSLSKSTELYKQLGVNEEDIDDYDNEGNKHKIHRRNSDYIVAKAGNNKFIVGYPRLNILEASGDKFELYVIKKARGVDKRAAVERAKAIDYKISQGDSTIVFNEIFTTSPNEKFRVQEIEVILKVPRGKVVFLDKSLTNIIYDIENKTNTYDGDMVNRRWVMGANGLECVDCSGLDIDDDAKSRIPPPPPPHDINVDAKDANVNIDKNGIHVKSNGTDVNVGKGGIHINTKGDKGEK
ncbi:MAG TPA: PspC domain-containing protein [Bacteroidia bacterium]|jgi:phage shock protein PspC (stress-responsive transcriptional regulator)|nr:PspC domain-containing protein [Bacteroidia bacterium]